MYQLPPKMHFIFIITTVKNKTAVHTNKDMKCIHSRGVMILIINQKSIEIMSLSQNQRLNWSFHVWKAYQKGKHINMANTDKEGKFVTVCLFHLDSPLLTPHTTTSHSDYSPAPTLLTTPTCIHPRSSSLQYIYPSSLLLQCQVVFLSRPYLFLSVPSCTWINTCLGFYYQSCVPDQPVYLFLSH